MENKKILTLALYAALEIHKREEEYHREVNNEESHARVNAAWNDVQELSDLVAKEERENK